MTDQLNVNIKELKVNEKKVYLVTLEGKVDAATVDDFQQNVNQLFTDGSPLNIILDLSDLQYINSKFVGYVLNWQMQADNNDGKVVLIGAKEYILDVLNVQGVLQFVPHCLTREEAQLLF